MNTRAILAIAKKDLIDAIRNLYILFGLLLPLALSLLFRVVFSDSGELPQMTIVVYDPGGSQLVAGLRSLPQVTIREVDSLELLPEETRKTAVGGLAIPAGFDAAVVAGEKPELEVYINRRHGGGEVAAFQQLVDGGVWSLVDQAAPARIAWNEVGTTPGFRGEARFNNLLLVMFLVMALGMTGTFIVPTLLVEEKEKHTLDSLLVSPAEPAEVAAGKALVGLVYSLLVAGGLILLNQGWVGNLGVTIAAVLLGSLFVVMVGLWMGSIFQNTQQVNTWSSIILLALLAPSWIGMIGPETTLEVVLRVIPTYYLVHALGLALAGEATLALVWRDLAILAASTAAVFFAVVWTMRRESYLSGALPPLFQKKEG